MYSVLKPNGRLILVTGPNTICGFTLTHRAYRASRHSLGIYNSVKLIDHISRGACNEEKQDRQRIASGGFFA
jgi:hypothetical protein